MQMRAKEDGKSEGHLVMRWIEVESEDNITSRESGQTSIGCLITREFGNPFQEECRMTGQKASLSAEEQLAQIHAHSRAIRAYPRRPEAR